MNKDEPIVIEQEVFRPVRCIDCGERRDCDHVRINKFARKPCSRFTPNLDRAAGLNKQRGKKV